MTNFKSLTAQDEYKPRQKFKSVFITSYESTYEDLAESFKKLKPTWYSY